MTDLPTPLTDAKVTKRQDPHIAVIFETVSADFARDLERRLAAARKLLAEARRDYSDRMNLAAYERIQEAINHLTP